MATTKDTKKKSDTKSVLSSFTIVELKSKLDNLDIKYKNNSSKTVLIELLENAEKNKVTKTKVATKKAAIEESKPVKAKTETAKKATTKSVKVEKKPTKVAPKTTKKIATKTTKLEKTNTEIESEIKTPKFKKSSKLASLDTFYSSLDAERSKVTVIMRDSKWLFAYWELGGNLFTQCKNEIMANDGKISTISLRVINENGNYYDIDISYGASSFYFEPKIEGHLKVEIGLKNSSGRFYSIAISNTITVDSFLQEHHSDEILWMNDDKQVSVSKNSSVDTQVIVESLGGAKYIKKIIGSEEFLEVLKENLSSAITSKFISKIVTSFISSGISSEFTSENSSYHSNTIKESVLAVEGSEDDAFWLIANTELILYGATEPDANLTVAGKKISLNEDGTFFLRMPLPDGDVDLPVEAYSSNGKHYRKINPQVKKWTK